MTRKNVRAVKAVQRQLAQCNVFCSVPTEKKIVDIYTVDNCVQDCQICLLESPVQATNTGGN